MMLLETYSVYDVLASEIQSVVNLSQATIDGILVDAQSPVYFNETGFSTSGVNNQPSDLSNSLVDLSEMNPFVPNDM